MINQPAFFAEEINMSDPLGDLKHARLDGRITNEHAASSYGQPVFVSADGIVYGPGDAIVAGRRLYVEHTDDYDTVAKATAHDAIVDACAASGWRVTD